MKDGLRRPSSHITVLVIAIKCLNMREKTTSNDGTRKVLFALNEEILSPTRGEHKSRRIRDLILFVEYRWISMGYTPSDKLEALYKPRR
ncbi:hypothetical protein Hdeb2414_s0103g00794411 [Helianthus debilis subsp. tardiflorus]